MGVQSNNIASLMNLEPMEALTNLDVSKNKLETLDGIERVQLSVQRCHVPCLCTQIRWSPRGWTATTCCCPFPLQAASLAYLDASENQLSDFNAARLVKVPSLRVLALRSNALSSIPLAGSTAGLVAMDLSGNRIRSLVRAGLCTLLLRFDLDSGQQRVRERDGGA